MLSRHHCFYPVSLYKVPSRAQQHFSAPSGENTPDHPANSSKNVELSHECELCSTCLQEPFGTRAFASYQTAWTSYAGRLIAAANDPAHKISFKYGRSIRQLRASAEEERCRWCGILLSAITQCRSLDEAARQLEAWNSEPSDKESTSHCTDGEGADESDTMTRMAEDEDVGPEEVIAVDHQVGDSAISSYDPEEEQESKPRSGGPWDDADAGFARDFIDNEPGFPPMNFDGTTYEVLDEFDHCDITMSYLSEEPNTLNGSGSFNTLETTLDVHAIHRGNTSHEMVAGNAVHLIAKLHSEPDDVASKSISTRPCEINLGNEASFEQARQWLATCRTHESCSSPGAAAKFIPTRVLDLRNPNKPKLCVISTEANGGAIEYAALSYTWGTSQTYITTKETIGDKMNGLDVQNLPQTIIDAIKVCGELGFIYLWVDSLCIIQDLEKDKKREISQMRLIYRCAALTIAAAKASDVYEGFLDDCRPAHFLEPFKIPFHCPDGRLGTAWVSVPRFYRPRNDPWNSRAWTLEEQLLSPRTLIYSYDGLKWLCKTSLLETSGPICRPRPFLELPRASEKPQENSLGLTTPLDLEELRERWYDILSEYTERSVTHEKDKLVALAAVAEDFQHLWGGEYLAGLWGRFLFDDLLWRRDVTLDFQPWLELSPRPCKYRAPTWSWASVKGKVLNPYGGETRSPCEFSILDRHVDLKWDDVPFGPVISGYLKVDGMLGTGHWCSSTEDDFCDGFIARKAGDTQDDAVAQVSLDAVEPDLIPECRVFCLLASQITTPSTPPYTMEGFVLLPTDKDHYRRVGLYSECRAFAWTKSFERRQITII